MTVAEEKFSAKFEEVAANIKHRGAYYLEDAKEKAWLWSKLSSKILNCTGWLI